MVFWLVAAAAYLAVAFVASAMTVRFAPRHPVSRQLRRRLAVFPFVPPVLLVAALAIPIAAAGRIARLLLRLFEVLSGRRQFTRLRFDLYGYGYSSSRRERKSPPPAAASGMMESRPIVRVQTLGADAPTPPATGRSLRETLPPSSDPDPMSGADSTRLQASAFLTARKVDA